MNRDMKTWLAAFALALLGIALAVAENTLTFNFWELFTAPFTLLGSGLRSLSLSGFAGNLAAWAVTLAVAALPLLLMRKKGWKWENLLLFAAAWAMFAMVFYAVNPGMLDSLLSIFYPIAALCTALSLMVGWWVLRLVGRMEKAGPEALAKALSILLTICALILAFRCAYGPMTEILAAEERFMGGDYMGRSRAVSIVVFLGVSSMRIGLNILTAQLMLLGAGLSRELGRMEFDAQAVEVCQNTARDCAKVARRTVEASAVINLLQLVVIGELYDSNFRLELPLLTLALAAGLYLLCRFLEQGHELQLDSDSII